MRHLWEGPACAHQLSGRCCCHWGRRPRLEPQDPFVWACAPRPPEAATLIPCPQPPRPARLGLSPCLKFRISLPGGFSFVSPPAHRGRWGRQGEIYPGKRKISLSLRECVSIPWLSPTAGRAAGLGVGWAAHLMLGKTCAGGKGGRCARAAGPRGSKKASWSRGCPGGLGAGGVSWSPAGGPGTAPHGAQATWSMRQY